MKVKCYNNFNEVVRKLFQITNFTTFSKELEVLCQNKLNFLDTSLLYLIRSIFGYEMVTLSNYQDANFNGVEVIADKITQGMKDYYVHSFQKRDPFAAHISEVHSINPDILTLKSSSVFAKNYTNNEYYQYLKTYGFSWSLAMPIGDYRLVVYKSSTDSDFGQEEHEALEFLATLIRNKYHTQQMIAPLKVTEDLESLVLDSMNVGIIVFQNENVKKLNSTAVEFLSQSDQNASIYHASYALLHFVNEQGSKEKDQRFSAYLEQKGKKYKIEKDIIDGEFPNQEYQALTIKPLKVLQCPESKKNTLIGQYGITQREFEICTLITQGMSYQEISDHLFISINTVRTHIRNAYRKLGINNQRSLGRIIA